MAFDLKNLSFHWQGRDKQGVSKWRGSAKPLYWIGRGFGIYGPFAGLGAVSALLYGLLTHHLTSTLTTLVTVGLIHCIGFTGASLWARAMYRHVMRLKPARQVCTSLGIEEATLNQIAAERKIKPRLILNEQPYYDPADFSDALSLLRASTTPQAAPTTLLRPSSTDSKTSPDELLRSADTIQPMQSGDTEPRS